MIPEDKTRLIDEFCQIARTLFNEGEHGDAIKRLKVEDYPVYEEFAIWFADESEEE